MKIFKRLLKISLRVIAGFIAIVALYLLAAFGLSRIKIDKELTDEEEITLYILTNGVHTDIVVPVKTSIIDWSKDIRFENTLAADTTAHFVAFGWGDKGFYLQTPTWSDLKFSVAFKAAFALSSSAIHATFYKNLTEGESCKSMKVSLAQYERLVTFIRSSLLVDENNKAIYIETDANYGLHDAFYEAKGSYNLFYTCNTWTNNALKACGQKACLWTPFDSGILYHYR